MRAVVLSTVGATVVTALVVGCSPSPEPSPARSSSTAQQAPAEASSSTAVPPSSGPVSPSPTSASPTVGAGELTTAECMNAAAETVQARCMSEPPASGDLPWGADLEGGAHTWSSGVRMTTRVEEAIAVGEEIDLCGDGSCTTSPEDVLVLLRYEVTAPADAAAAVEPGACPGWVAMGNTTDPDAVFTLQTSPTQPLAQPVAPGQTGAGYQAIVVAAEHADLWGLTLDSMCGDLDGTVGGIESQTFTADGATAPTASP